MTPRGCQEKRPDRERRLIEGGFGRSISAAEFRPPLRSQGAVHAADVVAEAEPPLDRLGVPVRLPRSGQHPRGCQGAGLRSRRGSGGRQFALGSGTSSGLREKPRMKSAALEASPLATKMKRGSFLIAWSQFPT